MEKKKMKIEIMQQTNYVGVTYFYLYVNGEFVKLSATLDEIEEAARTAAEIFKSGADEKTILESYEVER